MHLGSPGMTAGEPRATGKWSGAFRLGSDTEGRCVANSAAGQRFGAEAQCHQRLVRDIDTEPDAVLGSAGEAETRVVVRMPENDHEVLTRLLRGLENSTDRSGTRPGVLMFGQDRARPQAQGRSVVDVTASQQRVPDRLAVGSRTEDGQAVYPCRIGA